LPTPERTEEFARQAWQETVRLTGHAILETAFGRKLPPSDLVNAVCAGEPGLGLCAVTIAPTVPVVAVGGPVKVYYPEVGRRLRCEMLFPLHCEVANAVGAATGVVAQSVTVRVEGDGSGMFRVLSALGVMQFNDAPAALAAADEMARRAACDAALAMGADQPQVHSSVHKQFLPNSSSDAGLLEAVIVAEAIGRPNPAH
jgi:hypothetical protein